MSEIDGLRVAAAVALAAVPGVARCVRGRRLLRDLADPLLPERYHQSFVRPNAWDGAGFLLAVLLAPAWFVLTTVVWILARAAAAYPVRKALFEETWGFAAFLAFFVRVVFAVWAPWVGLVAAPAVIAAVPEPRAGVAAGTAAGLLLLLFAVQQRLLRWAFSAGPLARPDLQVLCDEVTARSRLAAAQRPVECLAGGPRGGRWANALALPSARRPAVLFGRDLLARLEPREVQAIFAHEVAHLEHYDARRLRVFGAAVVAAVLGGTVLVPLAVRREGAGAGWLLAVWAVVLALGLALRARGRQRNETASDLRALALGARPEALVSGLAKLYLLARLPRRLAPELERASTHPSLARRLRDVRRAAGLPEPSFAPRIFSDAARPSRSVRFDAAGVHWRDDGEPVTLRFEELTELRLVPRADGALLRARGATGAVREAAIAAADVGAVQALLDAADGRLGAAPPPSHSLRVLRLLSAVTAGAVALPGGSWLAVLVALLGFVLPGGARGPAARRDLGHDGLPRRSGARRWRPAARRLGGDSGPERPLRRGGRVPRLERRAAR